MNIREANEGDMEAVTVIYNASIPSRLATADLKPISLEQRLMSFQRHDPDRRPFWVADDGGAVVGYCSLRDFYGRPAYHATTEIAVYVHPEHQHCGVGSALLAHALADCPRLEVRTVLAFVFAANTPSLRLFERGGFTRWGLLPAVADLDGRWEDLVILGWQRAM